MANITGDRNQFAQKLFTTLPTRYNILAEVLSLGQNRKWRSTMVEQLVMSNPFTVLDVACGPAGVTMQLARRSEANIVGLDITESMLVQGVRNVENAGLEGRVRFVEARAEQLPFADDTFDALSFTYLLRYVDDPQATLVELARVVKPGGVMASQEFFVPPNRFWRAWWWGFTRWLLPVGGWLTGGRDWYRVGRFLGPNISAHYRRYSLAWTREAWQRAGFQDVHTRVMSLGGGLVMWGRRRVD